MKYFVILISLILFSCDVSDPQTPQDYSVEEFQEKVIGLKQRYEVDMFDLAEKFYDEFTNDDVDDGSSIDNIVGGIGYMVISNMDYEV